MTTMFDACNTTTSGHDAEDTTAIDIAVDLRALADWVEASWMAEEASGAPPLGRPLSFDRTASVESVLSSDSALTSSSCNSSSCSPDDPPDRLDDLDAFAPRPRPVGKMAWTAEEDRIIAEGVALYGNKWSRIKRMLPEYSSGRSEDSVRNRWQRLQRKQTRRALTGKAAGPKGGVSKYGDMWSQQEDDAIESGVIRYGLLFGHVAARLPGRTESGVRNRWLRNQSRRLAARGVHASGAPAVMAALRARGELGESGEYRPLAAEQPSGRCDAAALEALACDWIYAQVV